MASCKNWKATKSEVKRTQWPGTAPPLWPTKADKERNRKKNKNQKNLTQKQPPFTVKEVLSTHSLRHLTWNLNNKCQAVWMEDKKRFYRHKKLNQELFLSEEKLLHPTRHTLNPWTKQTNQVNQNITSVSVLQRHLMDAHGTGIKETNSLRFNRFYLFICWIWIFFWMNFDWIVPRASTREAFTVAHRHTHTQSHTGTGVWTHRQPDQEQDSKNSRSNTLLLMTCCRGWRLTSPDCISPSLEKKKKTPTLAGIKTLSGLQQKPVCQHTHRHTDTHTNTRTYPRLDIRSYLNID